MPKSPILSEQPKFPRSGKNDPIADRERTKEVLRESEAVLAAVLEYLPIGIWIVDTTGRVIAKNKVADRIWAGDAPLSGSPQDYVEYAAWDVQTGKQLGMDDYPLTKTLRTGLSISPIELRIRRLDGMEGFIMMSTAPLKDADGSLTGAVGINVDITERKQAEKGLREREEQLALAASGTQIGIFEWNISTSEIIGTEQQARLLGLVTTTAATTTAAATLSQTYSYHDWIARVHPDDIQSLESDLKRCLTEHCPFEVEYRIVWTDGSIHWVVSRGVAQCDEGGNAQRVLGILIEITERKRAEEQLIQNRRTFSELVERAPFGIYIVDSQFRIAHMNAGSQTGAFRNVRPVVGRDFSEAMRILWPEPVAAEIITRFRHTLETGNPYYAPRFTKLRHDVGLMESYEWELHRMTLPDGQYGVICYYFDSTALRNAELALQEAKDTLEKRVEERTHELAQLAAQLRALTGELTLAEQRERNRLANLLHDHLQQILVAAKFRLSILGRGGDDLIRQATQEIEELLDESIAASRSLTAELSPPILFEAGLNEGLQWLARRMASTQGLFVEVESNESGPLPEDLKILLFHSIRELLFNVVKHANTRSAVVNLRRLNNSLQVTVSDQGTGFDPLSMPSVGEKGRGFGLLGIQERVKYMGGTLEIKSSSGEGSQFVLSIPVVTPVAIEPQLQEMPVFPKAHLSAIPKGSGHSPKIRVMLADDHSIVRQGIANLLANEGDIDVVGEAADGQEAVELAIRLLPDVILMDVSMPKLSGVEATRAIRNKLPEIRIIGLSMFEDAERAQTIRDAGAIDYLSKSGPAEALIAAIRKSIQLKRKAFNEESSRTS